MCGIQREGFYKGLEFFFLYSLQGGLMSEDENFVEDVINFIQFL